VKQDPLNVRLRSFTHARVGLGRVGMAQPVKAFLDFQLGFARAKDAIYERFDLDAMEKALEPFSTTRVESDVRDRSEYLRRPDLGRRLSERSMERLGAVEEQQIDLLIVVADGLAPAAAAYAPELIHRYHAALPGLRIGPIILASNARVALGDHVAGKLGACAVMVMIGERPGLSVSNSLGLYLTWNPGPGTTDSQRNCVSNIHANGLQIDVAVHKSAWLIREAFARRLTGFQLKEEAGLPPPRLTVQANLAPPQGETEAKDAPDSGSHP
jgi:ethanolamine ammonia-lyase small subunit